MEGVVDVNHTSESMTRPLDDLNGNFSGKLLASLTAVEKTSEEFKDTSAEPPFGAFVILDRVSASVHSGSMLSTRLYIPKDIWEQDRVTLIGVMIKTDVFQALKEAFNKIHIPASSNVDKAALCDKLDSILELLRIERVHLNRAFPFLPVDQASEAIAFAAAESIQADGGYAGFGKLTNLAVGFGRVVKKQALAAVERAGAAQSVVLSKRELEEYAMTIKEFCLAARNIHQLINEAALGHQDDKTEAQSSELDYALRTRLEEISIFLDEVVVELLMRDLHSLLEHYLAVSTERLGAN